jgi:hypothetical protein
MCRLSGRHNTVFYCSRLGCQHRPPSVPDATLKCGLCIGCERTRPRKHVSASRCAKATRKVGHLTTRGREIVLLNCKDGGGTLPHRIRSADICGRARKCGRNMWTRCGRTLAPDSGHTVAFASSDTTFRAAADKLSRVNRYREYASGQPVVAQTGSRILSGFRRPRRVPWISRLPRILRHDLD